MQPIITQITAAGMGNQPHAGTTVFGLCEDNKLYKWDFAQHAWVAC